MIARAPQRSTRVAAGARASGTSGPSGPPAHHSASGVQSSLVGSRHRGQWDWYSSRHAPLCGPRAAARRSMERRGSTSRWGCRAVPRWPGHWYDTRRSVSRVHFVALGGGAPRPRWCKGSGGFQVTPVRKRSAACPFDPVHGRYVQSLEADVLILVDLPWSGTRAPHTARSPCRAAMKPTATPCSRTTRASSEFMNASLS